MIALDHSRPRPSKPKAEACRLRPKSGQTRRQSSWARTVGRFNELITDNRAVFFGVDLFPGSPEPASLQRDLDAGRPPPPAFAFRRVCNVRNVPIDPLIDTQ